MDEVSIRDILKHLEEDSIGLDKIHVSVSDNVNLETPNKKLTINAWMEIYKSAKTYDERKYLREVAINITEMYGYKNAVSEHGTFIAKFESSSPYNFFLTTVSQLEETFKQPYSVSFHEIIDYTGGEIVDSLHITFMLDLLWLATEYMLAAQHPKMTVIYGSFVDPLHENQIPFDLSIVEVEMPDFGCHHSKISILKYKNGSIRIHSYFYRKFIPQRMGSMDSRTMIRIFVFHRLWVSPILPPLPEEAAVSDGESITYFKKDFIAYLSVYEQPEINEWKYMICRIDCSAIKVFFFASVPGNYKSSNINFWGHKRVYNILKEQASLPDNANDWPVVAQSSSVGFFGQHYQSWISNHIVLPMAKEKDKKIIHLPEFRFLYPTEKTCENSFDIQDDVTPLAYYEGQHMKQQWIENHLYEWKFEKTGRARAMPHCKSYTRISPDETEIAWFILTSANLSKAAWGKMIKGREIHYIANYEAGVIFIPQIMINRATFPIKESDDMKVPVFLLPYDLPLSSYKPDMKIALIPGERPFGHADEQEESSEINSVEKDETDDFFNDERVKKILADLLESDNPNHSIDTK